MSKIYRLAEGQAESFRELFVTYKKFINLIKDTRFMEKLENHRLTEEEIQSVLMGSFSVIMDLTEFLEQMGLVEIDI